LLQNFFNFLFFPINCDHDDMGVYTISLRAYFAPKVSHMTITMRVALDLAWSVLADIPGLIYLSPRAVPAASYRNALIKCTQMQQKLRNFTEGGYI
jgi:hypothetical protein